MCILVSDTTKYEIELVAPCGKVVALSAPDSFNPTSDDVEIGVAVGTLMKLLGYERRGWQLNIKTTKTSATSSGTETTSATRQVFSR